MKSLHDPWSMLGRDEVLVVCDPGRLRQLVQARLPGVDVTSQPSYLAGIAALSQRSVRGLLVGVDPNARKLNQAVVGLRKAAGEQTRVILCCSPAAEPLARQAVSAGADDYLIYPPRGDELERALGMASSEVTSDSGASTPEVLPTFEEITGLMQVLSNLSAGRMATLQNLCHWIADCMRASSVRVVAGADSVHIGDPQAEPALVESIALGDRQEGQILVGARQRAPFTVAEATKLHHYAGLIAHLLAAAEQQGQWHRMAMLDELTGLPNRRYLLQAMEKLLQRAVQQRFSVTVLMFDLDGFKHFNDTYGHAAGDQILQETAQLFRQHCRRHDLVARYGGDEFTVVFWDADEPRALGSKHPTDVLAVLRRVKKALHSHAFPKLGPEATGSITISGGLASFPWDAADVNGLIERADEALMQAKRGGKNQIYLVGTRGEPGEVEAVDSDA